MLYQLAIGGTAVGTGLNTRIGFAEGCCELIAEYSSKTSRWVGSPLRVEASTLRFPYRRRKKTEVVKNAITQPCKLSFILTRLP